MRDYNRISKSDKILRVQKEKAWDLEHDIDWGALDASKPLLPIGQELRWTLGLTAEESLVLSQTLGLMAIQAISQHEQALQYVKRNCWEKPAASRGLGQDVRDLGEQFFADEAKHSAAFSKYLSEFARAKDIPLSSLLSILPKYEDSWACRLFRLNSFLGGRAVWWLVMLTEEESIELFRQLRPLKETVDPLYYQVHQLHFEEEVRHISYAPLMLRSLGKTSSLMGRLVSRFDYGFAEGMHFLWITRQLRRFTRVRRIQTEHPFFQTLADVVAKIDRLPLRQRMRLALWKTPFLSKLFRPMRHKAMRIELRRNRDFPSLFSFLFAKEA